MLDCLGFRIENFEHVDSVISFFMSNKKNKQSVDRGTLNLSGSLTAIAIKNGKGIATRTVDTSKDISISTDLNDPKSIEFSTQAPNQTGETGVLNACYILIQTLNKHGSNWDRPIDRSQNDSKKEEGVDCIALDREDQSKTLKMQVTRVTSNREYWRNLALKIAVSKEISTEDCVNEIFQSIDNKSESIPMDQRNDLILVLDSTIAQQYCYESVIKTFRENYGEESKSLGFKGIWLVGPSHHLTWQLDICTNNTNSF